MSKISGPADRPITTKERMSETEQTSETSSIQKTDIETKTRLDAEQTTNEQAPAADTQGQLFENKLGGMARQAELQSKLPTPSTPTLNEFPDKRSDLDPNVHLDEKIDVTKNLPDGHAINKGLEGLDWGMSKPKTGPNHMGVDLSTGGMKAPTDRIAEVLKDGKPGQPNPSAPQKGDGGTGGKAVPGKTGGSYTKSLDGGGQANSGLISKGKGGLHGTPPPGELSSRAPNMGLVGSSKETTNYADGSKTVSISGKGGTLTTNYGPDGKEVATTVVTTDKGVTTTELYDGAGKLSSVTKASTEEGVTTGKMYNAEGKYMGKVVTSSDGQTNSYDKKGKKVNYVDPDAGGSDVSAEDIARKVKVLSGSVEHGINPDLGVSGGTTGSGELKKPIDLLSDPIGDGESSVETSSPEKAKLAADIHGPRTVNPDSGYGGVKPNIKGGADPVPNQGEDID